MESRLAPLPVASSLKGHEAMPLLLVYQSPGGITKIEPKARDRYSRFVLVIKY